MKDPPACIRDEYNKKIGKREPKKSDCGVLKGLELTTCSANMKGRIEGHIEEFCKGSLLEEDESTATSLAAIHSKREACSDFSGGWIDMPHWDTPITFTQKGCRA